MNDNQNMNGLTPNQNMAGVPNQMNPVNNVPVMPNNQTMPQNQVPNQQASMPQPNNPAPVNPQPVNNNGFVEDDNRFINIDNTADPMANNQPVAPQNPEGVANPVDLAPSYVNDPEVLKNIQNAKKNTIPISKELKLIIIISLVMLVFIFVMPTIFDFLRNIKYR